VIYIYTVTITKLLLLGQLLLFQISLFFLILKKCSFEVLLCICDFLCEKSCKNNNLHRYLF